MLDIRLSTEASEVLEKKTIAYELIFCQCAGRNLQSLTIFGEEEYHFSDRDAGPGEKEGEGKIVAIGMIGSWNYPFGLKETLCINH